MRYNVFSAALLLLVVSCSFEKEGDIRTATPRGEVFHATTEAQTKVFADANFRVLWNKDDVISLFNKTTYNRSFQFQGADGDAAGDFEEIDAPSGFYSENDLDHVYAVYPYAKSNKIDNSGNLTVTLPSIQAYKADSFGLGANTMVIRTDSHSLNFKNVCGYLDLQLYGDGFPVRSITLKSNAGELLAGQATVTIGSDLIPSVTLVSGASDASDEITLVCEEPVVLSSEVTHFWIVVPPITFTQGFTITVTTDRGVYEKKTTKTKTIVRSKMTRMSALELTEDNLFVPFDDPTFEGFCVYNYDQNGDGKLSLAEALVDEYGQEITNFDFNSRYGDYSGGGTIYSLKGIECFRNITQLSNDDNEIDGIEIESLDLSGNTKLTRLDISGWGLSSLDLSANTELEILMLSNLPALTEIDLSHNTKLKSLSIFSTGVTSLDLSANTSLNSVGLVLNNNLTTVYVNADQDYSSWSIYPEDVIEFIVK